MADPLEALRGAQSIRDPYADIEVQGAMPGLPWGAGMRAAVTAGGKLVSPAVRALRGLLGAQDDALGGMSQVHVPPTLQSAPTSQAVDELLGALQNRLSRVPTGGSRASPALGSQMAEFTPQGGEALYNASRLAKTPGVDLGENVYQRMMGTRGGLQRIVGE